MEHLHSVKELKHSLIIHDLQYPHRIYNLEHSLPTHEHSLAIHDLEHPLTIHDLALKHIHNMHSSFSIHGIQHSLTIPKRTGKDLGRFFFACIETSKAFVKFSHSQLVTVRAPLICLSSSLCDVYLSQPAEREECDFFSSNTVWIFTQVLTRLCLSYALISQGPLDIQGFI